MSARRGRADAYARVVDAVDWIVACRTADTDDPTVTAYMIARAALLQVRALRSAEKAAELAYRLADEFAGETK